MRTKSFFVVSISIVFSLLVCEISLRYIWPQPTWSRLIETVGSYYAPSKYNTFELKKNYSGTEPSMESPGNVVHINTTSLGFRGTEEMVDGKKKILVLGDSYTFGVYVENEETYPYVMGKKISEADKSFQVINAGYASGFETDQQYVWLKHNIKDLKPTITILGVFLGNDILGINRNAWRMLDATGLPSEWIADNLYVSPLGQLRNKSAGISTVGSEWIYKIPLLRESHLAVLVTKAWERLLKSAEGTKSGYHDEAFAHIFGEYSDDFLVHEKDFIKLIIAMKMLAESNGSKFAVALLPINFMVEPEKLDSVLPGSSRFKGKNSVYYDRLQLELSSQNIATVNIEKLMRANQSDGPFFPKNGEVHFNPAGNKFAGMHIYDFLHRLGYVK